MILQETPYHCILVGAHALGILLVIAVDECLSLISREGVVGGCKHGERLVAAQYAIIATGLHHTGKMTQLWLP